MTIAEKAVRQMEEWAKDDSHGYDQQYRWGQRGDYDCSAAVIQAYENAGLPVKTNGATYTGNIYSVFTSLGFKDVTNEVNLNTGAGLKRGDVLLNIQNHVALYCGDGKEVEASINEFGGVTGGQPGDQTGTEFLIRPYRNYPWDCVLRYDADEESEGDVFMFECQQIKFGDTGNDVKRMQALLRGRGFIDPKTRRLPVVDGSFGEATERCLIYFQKKLDLTQDGICGPATWKKLEYC